MRLFAIRKPDGNWAGCPAMSEFNAWRAAAHYTGEMIHDRCNLGWGEMERKAIEAGYRCVEVNLVEVNTTTAGGV